MTINMPLRRMTTVWSAALAIFACIACTPQQAAVPQQIIVVEQPAQQHNPVVAATPIPTLIPPSPLPTSTAIVPPTPNETALCDTAIPNYWTTASNMCTGKPSGLICNGGTAPRAEPDGPVNMTLASTGALVEVEAVTALHTPRITSLAAGILWLRLNPPIAARGLLLGEVTVRNLTPPDFPAWQSMLVQTGEQQSPCAVAPINSFILQSDLGVASRVVINGASLDVNGTVLVYTTADSTFFVTLGGRVRVLASGQIVEMVAGQQTRVLHNAGDFTLPSTAPAPPEPLDVHVMQYLPVAIFDRPILLPQPGFARTRGAVNMRTAPNTNAEVIVQIPAGQTLTVLGRNPEGDWLHVMLADGDTGWMFAELLDLQVGQIVAVYDSTPLPPQRYGDLGARAVVQAPSGVTLRQAPDVTFTAIGTVPYGAEVILLAQSPYSPWVKVDWQGTVGWIALISLQTNAVIAALPVDFDVPPPPQPTRNPGIGGNAFPDPDADD